ncbi:hypothetical protein [Blastococcus sp. SYSU DS0541]
MPSIRAAIAAAFVAVPFLTAPAHAGDDFPDVVYTSDRDGDNEIYRLLPDGRTVQLTHNDVHDDDAVWSPDGRRLAFVSDRDGDLEVFVMDAEGRKVRQLTRNSATPGTPAGDFSPAWSPDGRHIVFASDRDGGETEIYRMRADGTRQTRLTETDPTVSDYSPAWSPDGRHILFGSTRAGFFNAEVYRMRADGTHVRRLTDTPDGVDDDGAEYSPDGRTIVFSSNRGGDRDLYTMRADGRDVRRLAGVPAVDEWFPAWTPDGRQVVYWSLSLEGTSPDTAWIVERDGDDPRRLTEGEANDKFPNVGPQRGR